MDYEKAYLLLSKLIQIAGNTSIDANISEAANKAVIKFNRLIDYPNDYECKQEFISLFEIINIDIKPYLEILSKDYFEMLKLIEYAKYIYINDKKEKDGMCPCFVIAFRELYGMEVRLREVPSLIHEFNNRTAVDLFNGKMEDVSKGIIYWWDLKNSNPRIKYFDYLIELYQNKIYDI